MMCIKRNVRSCAIRGFTGCVQTPSRGFDIRTKAQMGGGARIWNPRFAHRPKWAVARQNWGIVHSHKCPNGRWRANLESEIRTKAQLGGGAPIWNLRFAQKPKWAVARKSHIAKFPWPRPCSDRAILSFVDVVQCTVSFSFRGTVDHACKEQDCKAQGKWIFEAQKWSTLSSPSIWRVLDDDSLGQDGTWITIWPVLDHDSLGQEGTWITIWATYSGSRFPWGS